MRYVCFCKDNGYSFSIGIYILSLVWKMKNKAAVELGRLGGIKGGPARAKKLSPERRKEIAQKAAFARWNKEIPFDLKVKNMIDFLIKETNDLLIETSLPLKKIEDNVKKSAALKKYLDATGIAYE